MFHGSLLKLEIRACHFAFLDDWRFGLTRGCVNVWEKEEKFGGQRVDI